MVEVQMSAAVMVVDDRCEAVRDVQRASELDDFRARTTPNLHQALRHSKQKREAFFNTKDNIPRRWYQIP